MYQNIHLSIDSMQDVSKPRQIREHNLCKGLLLLTKAKVKQRITLTLFSVEVHLKKYGPQKGFKKLGGNMREKKQNKKKKYPEKMSPKLMSSPAVPA